VLIATSIFAPPQAGEKDERRFEKRNLCSRVPRLRFHVSVFWSHAKSRDVLGGTLGENAAWCSGHGSSTQADGCGLSPAAGPARHVVLCGHRSVISSPPGRRRMFASSHFSTNPPPDPALREDTTSPSPPCVRPHTVLTCQRCCKENPTNVHRPPAVPGTASPHPCRCPDSRRTPTTHLRTPHAGTAREHNLKTCIPVCLANDAGH
jgi:hypothetical protein